MFAKLYASSFAWQMAGSKANFLSVEGGAGECALIGAVAAPGGISGKVEVFEHGVHDGLRARDLARCQSSIQDGLAGLTVIVPEERMALINPLHPMAKHITAKTERAFVHYRLFRG